MNSYSKPNATFADETESRLPNYYDYSHGSAFVDLNIYNISITGGDFVSPSFLINNGNGFFTEEW